MRVQEHNVSTGNSLNPSLLAERGSSDYVGFIQPRRDIVRVARQGYLIGLSYPTAVIVAAVLISLDCSRRRCQYAQISSSV
jgi:hypothetical protein